MIAVNSLCFLAAGKDSIIIDSLLLLVQQYVNMCSIRFRTPHTHSNVIRHTASGAGAVSTPDQPEFETSAEFDVSSGE